MQTIRSFKFAGSLQRVAELQKVCLKVLVTICKYLQLTVNFLPISQKIHIQNGVKSVNIVAVIKYLHNILRLHLDLY